jgi:hypothetical protein
MDNMPVRAGVRARRRCGSPCYRTQTPSDRRTNPGTMPTAGNRADYSPGAGAQQAVADRSLGGIVRIREGRRRQ